jgi:hypothetical protein
MRSRFHAVLTIACSLAAAAPAVAQAVRVAGTSVTMTPPDGFSPAQRFPGFERADLQASIMVTELPTPAAQMRRGMTKDALATRGMTLIASTLHRMDGEEALLLNVSQSAAGGEYLKWMLITGDRRKTIMIVGTFPRSAESDLSDPIRTSVLTAHSSAAAPADPLEGLQFRVTPGGILKVAGRMSNMLILTESGNMGPQGPDSALLAVGSSIAAVPIDDLRAFSETRAKQTAKTTGLRVVSGQALTIDALDGYELVAEAADDATGKPVTLYQVVLPDGGGYVIMQGLIATARAAVMVPEFRRVAATFRRVPTRRGAAPG